MQTMFSFYVTFSWDDITSLVLVSETYSERLAYKLVKEVREEIETNNGYKNKSEKEIKL